MFRHEQAQNALFAKRARAKCRNYRAVNSTGETDYRATAPESSKNLLA
jgi:hypothetical protein